MLGKAKHQIKRAWRFRANDRVEPTPAIRGVVARLLTKRNKWLPIAKEHVQGPGMVLDQSPHRVQHPHNRADHVGQGQGQPAAAAKAVLEASESVAPN